MDTVAQYAFFFFYFFFGFTQLNGLIGHMVNEMRKWGDFYLWGELSYECGASCLGTSFVWGELSRDEFYVGRVVFRAGCP